MKFEQFKENRKKDFLKFNAFRQKILVRDINCKLSNKLHFLWQCNWTCTYPSQIEFNFVKILTPRTEYNFYFFTKVFFLQSLCITIKETTLTDRSQELIKNLITRHIRSNKMLKLTIFL